MGDVTSIILVVVIIAAIGFTVWPIISTAIRVTQYPKCACNKDETQCVVDLGNEFGTQATCCQTDDQGTCLSYATKADCLNGLGSVKTGATQCYGRDF
jgi:hypothetical protein